ncbi:glycine cleavage H-protein-domain-containing protein [Ampelomyces quisqualis]|uniref:Glycine cleavage system H protein n=1 Tax=Ampelomyces quisqualis TaxID=50730 RepID=A0A6A5R168_AMPQU|nr:glycine cleavage H-protein-domain-containing protein [Ampelomyces quisqualis]
MAARSSAVRVARQLTFSAARRPGMLVCQRWQVQAQKQRLFSVSAALKEKKYTEDHEWIELSADGKTCTLGISEYAAQALGDVVYIELPQTGMEVSEGDAIGAVESVKSASDILTPVPGTVAEVNDVLEKTPANINKDPEGESWIAKITVSGEPEGKLMSKEEYTAFTEDA